MFKAKDGDKVIPLLKPKTSGASMSPFSTKNLPKNKNYKIPEEDLVVYKNITVKIPRERILTLTHTTNNYLKSLVTKKNTFDDIKADMALKGLKGKEYIHSIGKWDEYIEYLEKNLQGEINMEDLKRVSRLTYFLHTLDVSNYRKEEYKNSTAWIDRNGEVVAKMVIENGKSKFFVKKDD